MRNKSALIIYILILVSIAGSVNFYTLKTLSGLRAAMTGESMYSKGEKDATLYLLAYIQTRQAEYDHLFRDAIDVPVSDNIARTALMNGYSEDTIKKYFIEGKNNPKDVEDMIWAFDKVFRYNLADEALRAWTSADTILERLLEIHRAADDNTELSADQTASLIYNLSATSAELSEKEALFSENLNQLARRLKSLLLLADIILGSVFVAIIALYIGTYLRRIKESEANIRKSVDIIENQNQRLRNFAYIVSHNIRSYAASMLTGAYLYSESETEAERAEVISDIKNASLRFSDTIDNLEKIISENATSESLKEDIRPRLYVEKCVDILWHEISMHYGKVINNVPADLQINFNPAYMESIMLNLISNAIKYRFKGRPPVITIDVSETEKSLLIYVQDNGTGINLQANGGKLFGMYQTFNGNADARGLGLFITKYQVNAMGGDITAESTLGEGTIFKLILPKGKG
ncbi:MAG: HAMP domain-containing histidine kinase [Taibaiella sp.]|nr:HAMP domain-containing histidine kinase [Taibaiella sp.]